MKDSHSTKKLFHELNNSFTQIISTLDLVLDELPEDSELRNDLQTVHASGMQAVQLVQELRDSLSS